MTAVLLTLVALAVLCWLAVSPARLATAGGALLVTHPAPTIALTAITALTLAVAVSVLVYRTLRAADWQLVTVQRPTLALVGAVTT
ncbi:hypothetical protein LUW74_40930 [Actinomadura madurae]|uniref:hypothetical protein n=1 Tax=Actinomadura madurae TaxID=1993 RepID=UPI002027612D|nr:hypothetical protein [Actinomadura madurae]URN09091.1 hypothetical protein LUW74_40930 [Actinomadura madurae]